MLPCQQAMMLNEALAFEKLIFMDKKDDTICNKITWDNPKELENFIKKLQQAAERLVLRNRLILKNISNNIYY